MVFPYPATQENLDRNPLYALTHFGGVKERRRAAGKSRFPWFVWLIFLMIGLMALSSLGI